MIQKYIILNNYSYHGGPSLIAFVCGCTFMEKNLAQYYRTMYISRHYLCVKSFETNHVWAQVKQNKNDNAMLA